MRRDGQIVRAGAGGLVRAVEREHGARRDGARGGHLAHVDRGEVALLEHRVGEGLGEVGDEPRVLVGRERVDVDVEELREPDEEVRGERPAVVLDEVQVARGDPELLGELDLVEALAAPERADLGAVPRGLPGGPSPTDGPADGPGR